MVGKLTSPSAFGFENEKCHYTPRFANRLNPLPDSKIAYFATNFFKVLGYVDPIAGGVRVFYAIFSKDPKWHEHLIRGCGEIMGYGKLIFALDILVTLGRMYQA